MAAMSPRRPLPPGAYGQISVAEEPRKGKPSYRAKVRFRDADGITRPVVRYGQTKGRARTALLETLADRQAVIKASTITGNTTVADLAELWHAADHQWSTNTRDTYRAYIDRHVTPNLAGMRLREIRPSVVNRVLTGIRDRSGKGAAKTTRTVLAGMFDWAIGQDAMQANPARGTVKIGSTGKAAVALTREQVDVVSDGLRASRRAVELDMADLVDWMLGTGMRIGEACAIRAASLDLDAGIVEVDATAVRHKGRGMVIQLRPKTAAGWRRLALPAGLVEMLRRRAGELRWAARSVTMFNPDLGEYFEQVNPGVVFPSPGGHLRDPSNTSGDLREVLAPFGIDATFHTFRKTVATRMDEAGLSARTIADQLGHSKPSMTLDVYMGRKVVSAEAARILDR
jgi:integrase